MIKTLKILSGLAILGFLGATLYFNLENGVVGPELTITKQKSEIRSYPSDPLNQGLKSRGLADRQGSGSIEDKFQPPTNANLSQENKEKLDRLLPVFIAPQLADTQRSKLVDAFKSLGVTFEPLDSRVRGSSVRMIDVGKGPSDGIRSVLIRSFKDLDNQRILEQIGFEMPGGKEALDYARESLQRELSQSQAKYEQTDHGQYFDHYDLENGFTLKLAWFPTFEKNGEDEMQPMQPSSEKPGTIAVDLFFGSSH